ncbi:MAG: DUF4844 domain-containing protein [Thiobacillus sp.]|nr:DUF4844 domain-containing protein [Thiobacillus sp.]
MSYDPLSEVSDEPLLITEETIRRLEVFRASSKFTQLPGENTAAEKKRLDAAIDVILDALIAGIRRNPSKLWVLTQFQPVLDSLYGEDSEAKEHFGSHLGMVMDILSIESSDGLLGHYLY